MPITSSAMKKIYDYVKDVFNGEHEANLSKIISLDNITDENEKKINKIKIKNLDNEILYYKEKLNNNFNIFSKYQKITKLNRIIVEEFIDKIYIGKIDKNNKNRIIQIKWNFK